MRAGANLRVGAFLGVSVGIICAGRAGEGERAGLASSTDTLPELVLIGPGTKVGRNPPPGWSDVVLRSIPRLASGDLGSLPSSAKATATMFRTAVLAEVRPAAGSVGYELKRIGIGICVPVGGADTVVSTASLGSRPVALGLVQQAVLGRAEDELGRGRFRGRTATFALFSSPSAMKVGGAHKKILLRYAFLVDPAKGALRTVTWTLDADPSARAAPEHVLLLPPDLVDDCELDVVALRVLDTIPVSWSFAMNELPPGRRVILTPELRALARREGLDPAESARFEAGLRRVLAPLESAGRSRR